MLKPMAVALVLSAFACVPALAQGMPMMEPDDLDRMAAMELPPSPEEASRWSAPTSTQSNKLNLPPTTTASLALKQQNLEELPRTVVTSIVKDSGYNPKVFSDEGRFLPPINGFNKQSHLENAFSTSPGLTTGHKMESPSSGF